MKKYILFVFGIIILLNSCLDVRFLEATINKKIQLSEFPKELQGNFLIIADSTTNPKLEKDLKMKDTIKSTLNIDTVKIHKDFFSLPMIERNQVLRKDSLELVKYNDTCYILAYCRTDTINNIKSWTLFPFTHSDQKIIINSLHFIPQEEHESIIAKIEGITSVKRINQTKIIRNKIKKTKKIEYYVINPNEEEFKTIMESQTFRKWMTLKKIKQ